MVRLPIFSNLFYYNAEPTGAQFLVPATDRGKNGCSRIAPGEQERLRSTRWGLYFGARGRLELPLAAEIDPVAVQAGGATVLRIIGGKTGLPWLRRD